MENRDAQLQRHPYGHSIPLAGLFAARSAPCPNPPPLRRHAHPPIFGKPKKMPFRALRSVIPRYRIPLGPFVLAQIPPRAAPSRSPAQFSASANAPPASAYLTMVALLLLGVYYHKIRCVVWPVAFVSAGQFLHDAHDGRKQTQIRPHCPHFLAAAYPKAPN